jgi:hypothetical protein
MLSSSTSPSCVARRYSSTSAPAVAKPSVPATREQEELLEMDIHTFDQRASSAPFRLSSKFVAKFKDRQPPFGFNGLGGTLRP